jgi:non-specific serine/threonine protein kinase
LVEAELPDAMGMARGPSVSRIAEEFANIASVLPWLIHHEPARSAALLGQFAQNPWMLVRAHVALVGEWLDRTLEVHVARDAARVHGLLGRIAILLQLEVDLAKARRMADEAIAISTEIGDASVEALARRESALVAIWEDPARALDEYNRAIPLLRTHHLGGLALALSARAVLRGRQGDGAGAQRDLDEAHLTWRRYVGPSSSLRILTLVCASDVAFAAGDLSGAEARARDAVDVALNADDIGNATTGPLLILPLEFLAHLAALAGHSERAALLSGFTDRRREETGIWPRSWFKLADRTWLADVEHRLGRRARTLRSEGRRLTVAEAISCAVGARRPSELTAREFSVTELVARGHTDKEIAARLTISERTAESHVRRSLEKLGLRSRAELGRWAAEHAAGVG